MLQTLPLIREAYIDTGKVRYLFKDFPLPSHSNAQKAAEAARCAGAQGAFLQMHHRLYDAQREWSSQDLESLIDTFARYAQELELDKPAYQQCLASGQFTQQVRQDLWEGQQAGVSGTPSFLINGQLLVGAHPFESFQQIIEAELQGEQ